MVPVAQWLERVTVDDEVEGSTPFRHPPYIQGISHFSPPYMGAFFLKILVRNHGVMRFNSTKSTACYNCKYCATGQKTCVQAGFFCLSINSYK